MASGTTSERPPHEPSPLAGDAVRRKDQFVEYERFIDGCVSKTGANLKVVDLASGLVGLAVAVLSLLLVAAVLDHWLLPGGLGLVGRLLFLTLLIGATVYFLALRVAPIVFRRVNPIYAAHTIEASSPALKNTLLNFLLFRRQKTVAPAVYDAIEEQAAVRLSATPVETAVDRGPLLHVIYALVAVAAVAGLYKVLSPKDPWQTAARVFMPLADIQTPSRVKILDVQPSEREIDVPRGDSLEVSADVEGVGADDPVTIYYTTAGGQRVDQPIVMHVPAGQLRYRARLPEGGDGVQQDLQFHIAAGDAVTPTYTVRVTAAPTITVQSVYYQFPEYTGYSGRRVEGQGDLRAIEGTRVTILAKTNSDIKSARLDFDGDGRSDLPMQIDDDRQARVSFTLQLAEDRQGPQHTSYQLWYTNTAGHKNRHPVLHTIETIADKPPEIELAAPSENEVSIPLDGAVELETVARDPDFALLRVTIEAEVDGRKILDEKLLDQERTDRFLGRLKFVPRDHRLEAGDVVEYWATAQDNKSPEPNIAKTERRRIHIVEPSDEGQQKDAARDGQQSPDQQQDRQADGQPDEQNAIQQDGQPQENDSQQNKNGEQGEQQQSEQSKDGQQQEDGQSEGQSGQQPQGKQQNGKQQQEGQQNDGQQQSSGQEGQTSKSDGSSGRQQPDGQQTEGQQQSPENSTGDENAQPTDGSQPGGEQGGQHGQNKGQPGGPKDQDLQQPTEPVPSDGTDDGTAFERIRDHLEQQGEQDSAGADRQDRDASKTEGGQADSGQKKDSQGASAESDDAGARPDQPMGQQDAQDAQGQRADDRDAASPDDAKKPAGEQAAPADDSATGLEQQQKPDGQPEPTNDPTAKQPEPPSASQGSQGKAGSGEESDDSQGSPQRQTETRPDDKTPDETSASKQTKEDQPQSPAHGNKESDSRGGDQGDKVGGGKKGGGQQADRSGKGEAGEHEAADDGSGRAADSGAGETTDKPGDDTESDHPTGQSDGQAGRGSEGQQSKQGNRDDASQNGQQGEAPSGSQPGGQQPAASPDASRPPEESRGPGGQAGRGLGGGESGSATTDGQPPTPPETGPTEADKANLEYARKVTDLVLERLDQQVRKDQVDPKLLDKLGWTKDDMRRFLDRWRQLKSAPQSPQGKHDEAQRELDAALQSLGLRKERLDRGHGTSHDDMRGLRESQRQPTPAELQEKLKAYLRGTSRSE